MKFVSALTMFLLACGLSATIDFETGATFTYDDNVFNLSDSDLDHFDDGSFDWAETSDDFVTGAWLRVQRQFQVGDVYLTPVVKGAYSLYTSNGDKSTGSMLAGVQTDWRKLSVNAYYGYYPHNYLRTYDEDYTYDKNMYKLDGSYRIFRKDWVQLYGKYEQYCHNKYYTKYDGDAITTGIGWRHSFQTFYLKAMYYYRTYNCDGETNLDEGGEESSADYDADIFELNFNNKKVEIARNRYIRPYINFSFEHRCYQTNDYTDDTHAGREDKKYNVAFGSEFLLWKDIELTAEYNHVYRKVSSSVNSNLPNKKDYIANELSLGVRYSFSL